MIEEITIGKNLTFDTAKIAINKTGLIVFSGPSGSGKSVFMNAVLDVLAVGTSQAESVEVILEKPKDLVLSEIGITSEYEDIICLKKLKRENTRYYIDNQLISKKKLQSSLSEYINYLKVKDFSDFENANLINILDLIILKTKQGPQLKSLKKEFTIEYNSYKTSKIAYDKILKEEEDVENLLNFAKFEIKEIEDLNPTEEEYKEIFEIKQKLNNIDKIKEKFEGVDSVLEQESKIYDLLELLNKPTDFAEIFFEELNNLISEAESQIDFLSNYDLEDLLDKIEQYSKIIKKYGSVKDTIIYLTKKNTEIEHYENISFEKTKIEKTYKQAESNITKLSQEISNLRNNNLKIFEKKLNLFLKKLYIDGLSIKISKIDFNLNTGIDFLEIELNNTVLKNISTGEFNRLRLGIMALKTEYVVKEGGVLLLDEIDANLSGEETMSVAEVLRILSKQYQIMAISHSPQLTAYADQHFYISKNKNKSSIKELTETEKISEIARLVSGKNITKEAKEFALQFRKEYKESIKK
jgi:DNA repair protein RecN (Recombination protein N)